MKDAPAARAARATGKNDVKPVLSFSAGAAVAAAAAAAASSSASSPASTGSNFARDDVPVFQHHGPLRGQARSHSPPQSSSSQSPAAAAAAAAGILGRSSNHVSSYPSPSPSGYGFPEGDFDLPETRDRRLWEMRLLHNQQTEMIQVFPTSQSSAIVRLWSHVMPEMALRDGGALLHIILASSALNLWHKSIRKRSSTGSGSGSDSASDSAERDLLMELQTRYLTMCFQAQRRDVANLSSRNADYVCFTSLKIVSHSVALVQTLPAPPEPEPWEPPLQWLHMGRGADEVFRRAAGLVSPEDGDQIMTFLNSPPALLDEDTTSYDRSRLAWLLDDPGGAEASRGGRAAAEGGGGGDRAEDRDELEDGPEARQAYEKAISYTCSVQGAIERGEPVFAIVRRLAAFSVFVPPAYTQLLAERRPRAMVILAHFMALWLDYEDIWLIGQGGRRQIRGILANLPPEWRGKLDGLLPLLRRREEGEREGEGDARRRPPCQEGGGGGGAGVRHSGAAIPS
ncbi:hypothetical protein SLS62_000864 [Diatrype stigma]|uniref:Uncharacterized protein n=1 Tax=Diatrype stigma TaxID=117547 RepID=A0AAN9UXC2_9PEZI